MTLDSWLKKAKKDGVVKEENKPSSNPKKEDEKMELKEGSSPSRKEPRDILPKSRKQLQKGQRPSDYNALNLFYELCPIVKKWLAQRRNKRGYGYGFLCFCIEANIMPKDFGELNHSKEEIVKARDLVWDVCTKLMDEGRYTLAKTVRKCAKAFYKWVNKAEVELPFDARESGYHYLSPPKEREAYDWGTVEETKELFFNVLAFAPGLTYRTIFLLDFVTGWRKNAFESLKWKHFETPGIKTINDREVLIVKITKEIDSKQAKALKYYWSFIAGEALEVFKQYKETCSNREPESYVFRYKKGWSKGNTVQAEEINKVWKIMMRKAESQRIIPKGSAEKLWFHQIRKHCFRKIMQNADGIEYENKEFLMGHKLKGSAESYATRHYESLAPEYFKANFDPPIKYYKDKHRFEEQMRQEAEARIERYEKVYPDLTELPEEIETVPQTQQGWQSPKMEEQTLPYKTSPPQEPQPTPKTDMEQVKEHIRDTLVTILQKPPKNCLRRKNFAPTDDASYCINVCKKLSPNQFKACMEINEEKQQTPKTLT